jgi:hypothetical protein
MDVAAFVGFAASGPLGVPVAVEDVADFESIFGGDALLAWDAAQGEFVHAHLAPAVRAFFRNGGRRCWVVRVAGSSAAANSFPLPGMVALSGGVIAPAFAPARSEGSWSDGLRVSTALVPEVLSARRIGAGFPDELSLDLVLPSVSDLAAGDLLRLTFAAPRPGASPVLYVLMLVAAAIEPIAEEDGSPLSEESARAVRVTGSAGAWFATAPPPGAPIDKVGAAHTFGPSSLERSIPVRLDGCGPSDAIEAAVSLEPLDAADPSDPAWLPGTMLRVDFGSDALWLRVEEARFVEQGSPLGSGVRIAGKGLFHLPSGPSASDVAAIRKALPVVERLAFEIWTRQDKLGQLRSGELGFAAASPLFWAALPSDAELYRGGEVRAVGGARKSERDNLLQATEDAFAGLRARAVAPRFPLAGRGAGEAVYLPIAMPIVPDVWIGPAPRAETEAARDGLDRFDAAPFLDPALGSTRTAALLGEADFLRYESPSPRTLRGIYAVLALEEVTLVAVPDAVHRGWEESDAPLPPPRAPVPPARLSLGSPDAFRPCGLRVLDAPELFLVEGPSPVGTYALEWSSGAQEGASYTVEESLFHDFRQAAVVYAGERTRLEIHGRAAGDYYYRARVEASSNVSSFSSGTVVRVEQARRGRALRPDEYSSQNLLAIQRALLRMCAARADLFAVLSLPEHYREAGAVAHAALLRSRIDPPAPQVPALSAGEVIALSYGALYHPWLIGREQERAGELRRVPPDGAAAGVIAQRASERGAWVAPANEELRGVVALAPPLARERLLGLKDAAVNVVRREPRGFLVLGADTLSDDPDLTSIGVRRLLILLRRAALRLGAVYVFEPNDPAFRRAVGRGFEAMLGQMYLRGAFAGQRPEDAFQVVTDATLNPHESVEAGRFVVELKVAPSRPLLFLTVRLVQSGDRSLVTEVR